MLLTPVNPVALPPANESVMFLFDEFTDTTAFPVFAPVSFYDVPSRPFLAKRATACPPESTSSESVTVQVSALASKSRKSAQCCKIMVASKLLIKSPAESKSDFARKTDIGFLNQKYQAHKSAVFKNSSKNPIFIRKTQNTLFRRNTQKSDVLSSSDFTAHFQRSAKPCRRLSRFSAGKLHPHPLIFLPVRKLTRNIKTQGEFLARTVVIQRKVGNRKFRPGIFICASAGRGNPHGAFAARAKRVISAVYSPTECLCRQRRNQRRL